MQRRATTGWLLLLLPVTVLFYWKILLTRQFSLLTSSETVNQGYSWMQFVIASVRSGVLPIWDPYTLAGHSFPGEMQTAPFYPVHLLLALIPSGGAGVLSAVTYHWWFAATHVLAACFMFALVREFGLSRFSAFIAGIVFTFGGYLGRLGWPHMLESAVWLPLIFLFFLRALGAATVRLAILYASAGGLMFGLSVLAGGLHVVIMDALVIASAGIFYACSSGPETESRVSIGLRAGIVVSVIGVVGVAAGAVQLFPSIEYSARAIRFLGPAGSLPADQRIPYFDITDKLLPQSIGLLLAHFAFDGTAWVGEGANPYMGVFPLLAAVIGIRRYWQDRWVRYLTGLAIGAFLFSLESYSWLHGVLYAVVPWLWSMREASRIVYLEGFALAILAAHGVEALLRARRAGSPKTGWIGLNRTLLGIVIASAAALFVPAIFGIPAITPWNSLAILLIFASYGLYHYLEEGHRGGRVQAMMLFLILFDLSGFDWTAINRLELTKDRVDHWDRIMSAHGAAQFLKAQPGLFRVRVDADPVPNIGDLFGVPIIQAGAGVTLPVDYMHVMGYTDLLNVRYTVTPAKEQRDGAVYQDHDWKVYENPTGFPRAWMVHETVLEPSTERAAEQLGRPGFDARRIALVEAPLDLEPLAGAPDGAQESVQVSAIAPNGMDIEVDARSRGLLVLSENFYPGWRATIDGQSVPIYRVDSGLRGLIVPRGHSRVELRYAPASFYWGASLTLIAFFGALAAMGMQRRARMVA